ncbi:MAG: hypothetical protein IPK82_06980 [Polyangiaceae bacterium]|nr:hypothetical protein [Polyangiaceae bacterium]
MILSLYDLTGIQRYIFGSNRLPENIGASYLTGTCLGVWLRDIADLEEAGSFQWAGGGNALLHCSSEEVAKRIATHLSTKLHKCAPGLSVACAHAKWDGENAAFPAALKQAYHLLDREKVGRKPDASFDGVGVTAQCASTGESAIDWYTRDSNKNYRPRWVGPSVRAKLEAVDKAEDAIKNIHDPSPLVYPRDLDSLGRTRGENSFVGVIHFDGNQIGKRAEEAGQKPDGGKALKEWSNKIGEAGRAALKGALQWVEKNLNAIIDPQKGGFHLSPVPNSPGEFHFPVRPLLFGGDDISLVCDGRLALDLGAQLILEWRKATTGLLGSDYHACVGVALVKSHYPFYQAYKLAEALCKNAKKWLHENPPTNASALDYEIAAGGAILSLDQRRKQDVASASHERLHARPYLVCGDPPRTLPHRSWKVFRNDILGAFQTNKEWEEFRAQLHSLAPALRGGSEVARSTLIRWKDRFNKTLPVGDISALQMTGFCGSETPYLDAIELLDMVTFPLDRGNAS